MPLPLLPITYQLKESEEDAVVIQYIKKYLITPCLLPIVEELTNDRSDLICSKFGGTPFMCRRLPAPPETTTSILVQLLVSDLELKHRRFLPENIALIQVFNTDEGTPTTSEFDGTLDKWTGIHVRMLTAMDLTEPVESHCFSTIPARKIVGFYESFEILTSEMAEQYKIPSIGEEHEDQLWDLACDISEIMTFRNEKGEIINENGMNGTHFFSYSGSWTQSPVSMMMEEDVLSDVSEDASILERYMPFIFSLDSDEFLNPFMFGDCGCANLRFHPSRYVVDGTEEEEKLCWSYTWDCC
ncbi:hypothetical protein PCE1_002208 [Barthelona sp. PCE]